jgi:DNA-binding transcriptional LysR family regulator
MRVEQLRYLEVVARLGSFRSAAEELHLSQPALSETIRNLERELGVELLDRTHTGAKVSAEGRELFPYIRAMLEAIDGLHRAADEQHLATPIVRLGTVNTASAGLLAPVIKQFREQHPRTQVEIVGAQEKEIHLALRDGALDLGLVNYLDGDDVWPQLETTALIRGRAVVCMPAGNPLAARREVTVDQLLTQPLIVMRAGYVMHRFIHRLLDGREADFSYSTDGAEMGKLMVAKGLGVTILPEFSVSGDPLRDHGLIVSRPLAASPTDVILVLQRSRSGTPTLPARDLHRAFVAGARALIAGPQTGGSTIALAS